MFLFRLGMSSFRNLLGLLKNQGTGSRRLDLIHSFGAILSGFLDQYAREHEFRLLQKMKENVCS